MMFSFRFGFAAFFAILLSAVEASSADKLSISQLVAKLESTNKSPKKITDCRYTVPESFRWEVQGEVHQAWDELKKAGPEAIPILIDKFDDPSYSTTIASPLSDCWHNETVGWVAREIVTSQIQPFSQWQKGEGDPRDRAPRPKYARAHLHTKKAALEWWKEREKLSLRELQIEVVEWTISEEAKHPNDYSKTEKAYLRFLRRKLEENALPPGNPSRIYRMSRDTQPL